MKMFFRICLCFLLIPLFAACGLAPTPAPTPEPTTLRFAYLGYDTDYQGLADEFHERYPNVIIELVPISLRAQAGGFDMLLGSFQEADVIRVNEAFLGMDQINAIYPLDEFIETSEDFPFQDFFAGSLEALRYEQRQLGVPAGLDPVVMHYENIRFTIAATAPLDADYTLDDFLENARKVNNQDASLTSGNFSYGFCSTPLDNDHVHFVYLFGGGVVDSMLEPSRPMLNSPASVEAIAWYARLWSEHHLTPKLTNDPYQTYGYVSSSTCSYWMNYLDMFGFAKTASVQGRVIPLPWMKASIGEAQSPPAFLDGYFITRNSSEPQAAWNWINFLVERQEASLDQIPPLTWQIDSEEYALRASPDVLVVARSLPMELPFFSLTFLTDPRSGQMLDLFSKAVRQVIDDGIDAQSALDEAQKQAEEIYSSSGVDNPQP